MARNVEIKGRAPSLDAIATRAAALGGTDEGVLVQEDTFFHVETGRLKLRRFADGTAELIAYHRPDHSGPKTSSYELTDVPDPDRCLAELTERHGVRGVVRKHRHLWMIGRTRVHLDRVEGLGTYVELEVVLREDESEADGDAEAARLMDALGISESDLVEGAYADLLGL